MKIYHEANKNVNLICKLKFQLKCIQNYAWHPRMYTRYVDVL